MQVDSPRNLWLPSVLGYGSLPFPPINIVFSQMSYTSYSNPLSAIISRKLPSSITFLKMRPSVLTDVNYPVSILQANLYPHPSSLSGLWSLLTFPQPPFSSLSLIMAPRTLHPWSVPLSTASAVSSFPLLPFPYPLHGRKSLLSSSHQLWLRLLLLRLSPINEMKDKDKNRCGEKNIKKWIVRNVVEGGSPFKYSRHSMFL